MEMELAVMRLQYTNGVVVVGGGMNMNNIVVCGFWGMSKNKVDKCQFRLF